MSEAEIIAGCKQKDRKVQEYVFKEYKTQLMGVIRRYVYDTAKAEDVLINAFVKIFSRIDTFSNTGKFSAWMRRIAIREALMEHRKNKRVEFMDPVELPTMQHDASIIENIEIKELYRCLALLPDGYRQVLNLYAIDGYKHREIADLLDISIHTSKSQLRMARKRFSEILEKRNQ